MRPKNDPFQHGTFKTLRDGLDYYVFFGDRFVAGARLMAFPAVPYYHIVGFDGTIVATAPEPEAAHAAMIQVMNKWIAKGGEGAVDFSSLTLDDILEINKENQK